MIKEKAISQAQKWKDDPYIDQVDRDYIQNLLKSPDANEEEIVESFYKDLEFGTGGMRAIIGIGSNRINKYNVRRATQAMCDAIANKETRAIKACLSFDCRKYSKEFAMEAASVFAANNIKTYIFPKLTPTPILSYAIRYFEAECGIMVTASHNPKQYNGFKAYWSDGAQVTPPNDEKIIEAYGEIESWNQVKSISFEAGVENKMIEWIEDDCIESFYKLIEKNAINPEMCKENGDRIHFIYTPLHGCGYPACNDISERMGFTQFEVVESQAVSDENFSTIETTPNPEDPKALNLAVALMKESNADIAYGTDPDCDRLGVVVNHKGIEHFLNGNQIAILMINYIFEQRKLKGTLGENPLVIKSIVTSPLQNVVVESFGGTVMDTLTGFKWMARLWKDLEDSNTDYDFTFASEESFGYLPYNFVRDKDAVSSIALMNEIALFYKLKNMTLIDALDEIYNHHGYAEESLIAKTYEGIQGSEKINKIMSYFRENSKTPIAGIEISAFRDYQKQERIEFTSNQTKKFDMTKSNVLCFEFTSGDLLFLRPSGTEPKIKFYTMVRVSEGSIEDKKSKAKQRIHSFESFIHETIEGIN